jgi:cell division septation protein DedD
MPRNEEGEFELVLGNRQLLSVFFIVVVLLGVFFVMGYILGKNSAPAPATEVASVRKPAESGPAPEPIIVDKTPAKQSAAGDFVKAPREEPKPLEPKPLESKPVEQKREEPKKPEPKREEPKKEEKKKAESKPEPPAPSAASAGASKVGMPPKGSLFMQVAAVGRAEADVVAKVLKGKGMSTWVAPTENEKIYRVLVGPIDKGEVGSTKADLVKMGFSPFPRSY